MICPHCAFPNEPDTKTCVKCRRPLGQPPKGQAPAKKTPGWLQAPVSKPPDAKLPEGQASAAPMSDRVSACLQDAKDKEQAGDLRSAFLRCQSLLIDHYGDIPDDSMAALYIYMSRISARQDKKERALKYLKKARTLAPKDPEIAKLAAELTAAPPSPIEQAIIQETAKAAEKAPELPPPSPPPPPPLVEEEDMPTPDERSEPEIFVPEKISDPPSPKHMGDSGVSQPSPSSALSVPGSQFEGEPAEESPPAVSLDGRLVWVAGFWARLLAFAIDTMLVGVVVVVMMLVSSLVLGHGALEAFDYFFQQISTLLAAVFVFALLQLTYLTIFTIFGGQTVGKMLLDLRVVGLDGHSVSATGALRRALGMLLAGLPGLAGFLWTAFDLERRGWHDYIGGTLVVHVHPKEMKAALSQG